MTLFVEIFFICFLIYPISALLLHLYGGKMLCIITPEQEESYSVKVFGLVPPFEHFFLCIFNMFYFFTTS